MSRARSWLRGRHRGGAAAKSEVGTLLPTRALLWLLAGFLVLLTPQWDRLPWWLIVACLLLAFWRWLAQQGTVRLPGRWSRLAVMVALTVAYGLTVRGQFSVDTAASFFVLAVGLKWLETRSSRDFFVLFFILTYLASVNFLFQQGILWTLVNLAGVVILLVALQLLHGGGTGASLKSLRRLAVMSLKTLPIVVLLFVFFPRMAPLWSVPLVSSEARTGISDTMSPGDISSLAQSRERAFRVTFGGDIPAHRERYWRGLILDRFDGETWRQWQTEPQLRPGRVALDGGVGELQPGQYDVLMEASGQRWVYALENSVANSDNLRRAPAGLFRLQRPADTAVRYRMGLSETGALSRVDPLVAENRSRYLQLPSGTNPRARSLAEELRASSESPLALIGTLMDRFNTEAYHYTLRPPVMPDNSVDALLFDEKRGFCAHYASATTFVLRAAGIPARVVIGYQGGASGAGGEYLIVRQYDAHAWVEAWIDGAGWVRVDPTAAISPDRIELGIQDAMADEGSFLENAWASPERYRNVPGIQWMSLQMDRLNYNWQRWVVGYQGQSQMDLMGRLPGNIGLRELGYITAGVLGLAMLIAGVIAGFRHHGGSRRDPAARLIASWMRLLEKRGVQVPAGATPDQLARLTREYQPRAGKPAGNFAAALNSHYYGPSSTASARRTATSQAELEQQLGSVRRAIARRRNG